MNKFLLALSILAPLFAQEHIPVPLADANRPVSLTIHLMTGSITVRGYSGHEVIVDTKGRPAGEHETHDGLHRIGGGGSGLTIESDNNKITITSHIGPGGDLTVQTPVNTSVNVKTLAGGQITIEGVDGEIEAQNLNGAVTVRNASGPVVASSLNGSVTVTMASVKSGSPMSFTTLNGNIDVTLPSNVAADFKMKTNHGDIYSDFDVKMKAPPAPVVSGKDSKGKYIIKTDGSQSGSVNGGGPEYRFSTLNGNIYIRKTR
jgi:hypothetical protein